MPAGWSTTHPSRAAFIADHASILMHGTGVQIDWENVDADDYADATTGKKTLPAGTRLGWSGGTEGLAVPRTDAIPGVGVLLTPAVEDDLAAPGGGMYGMIVGGALYENLLPGASGDPAVITPDEKTELGARFYWQQYGDTP
ncbi:MAG TPA: hypothetical protein VEB59_06925 [Gemmatimonadales bacterium]|nr:hypothetical protein [Gemmatimonadales bacterium]